MITNINFRPLHEHVACLIAGILASCTNPQLLPFRPEIFEQAFSVVVRQTICSSTPTAIHTVNLQHVSFSHHDTIVYNDSLRFNPPILNIHYAHQPGPIDEYRLSSRPGRHIHIEIRTYIMFIFTSQPGLCPVYHFFLLCCELPLTEIDLLHEGAGCFF